MTKVLTIDPATCTSCRLCEMACSQGHTGEYRPSRANVRVAIYPEDAIYFPVVCMQCDDAPCMAVCPSAALVRDGETNAVLVVEDRCVGCRICSLACPFGAINYWSGKAHKCDLCGGYPECVAFCPTEALTFETEERSTAPARQAFADRLRDTLKEVSPS